MHDHLVSQHLINNYLSWLTLYTLPDTLAKVNSFRLHQKIPLSTALRHFQLAPVAPAKQLRRKAPRSKARGLPFGRASWQGKSRSKVTLKKEGIGQYGYLFGCKTPITVGTGKGI